MIYDVLAINVDFPSPRGYHHLGLRKNDISNLKSQPNLKVIIVNSFHRAPSDNYYGKRVARLEAAWRTWRNENA